MRDYIEIKSTKRLDLAEVPVKVNPKYHCNQDYKALLAEKHALLNECQTLLYANHGRAMLIIFQGMDTSGKDGAIKHVRNF